MMSSMILSAHATVRDADTMRIRQIIELRPTGSGRFDVYVCFSQFGRSYFQSYGSRGVHNFPRSEKSRETSITHSDQEPYTSLPARRAARCS
jgi:hypothetical protein